MYSETVRGVYPNPKMNWIVWIPYYAVISLINAFNRYTRAEGEPTLLIVTREPEAKSPRTNLKSIRFGIESQYDCGYGIHNERVE